MRVVCISDTHSLHQDLEIPEGDLLVHAGDLTSRGSLDEVKQFAQWFSSLPHRHKVVIAGNHDFCFEHDAEQAENLLKDCHYLRDSGVKIEGLWVWGSPWQPWFHSWAFNLERGDPLRQVWAMIPQHTDILVTHGPPAGHCDLIASGLRVGCEDLLARVRQVRPRLHIFGHIHEAYGVIEDDYTTFLNASICNLAYKPVQAPLVVDL